MNVTVFPPIDRDIFKKVKIVVNLVKVSKIKVLLKSENSKLLI